MPTDDPDSLPVTIYGIPAPTAFGDLRRISMTNNETAQSGAGVSVGYSSSHIEATLYIYGRDEIPDGVLSEHCREHFVQCIQDVFQMARHLKREVSLVGCQLRGSDLSGPEFLQASFLQCGEQGARLSVLYLTARDQKFVKLRMTTALTEIALQVIEAAIDSYSILLWPARSASVVEPISV